MQLSETKRIHFQTITSTNDYLKEIINDYDKLIVTAEFQTAGRGRNSKVWDGKFGLNVYFSYGINHKKIPPFKNFSYYQLIGALSTYKTLVNLTNLGNFRIKYPNDIHFISDEDKQNIIQSIENMSTDNINYSTKSNSKKISGILAEHNFMGGELVSTIIGIGINVNQKIFKDELSDIVTSLYNLGFNFQIDDVIDELTKNIELLLNIDEDKLFEQWSSLLNLYDKDIVVINKEGIYRLKTILKDCRLLLIENNSNNELMVDNGDSVRYILS